MANDTSRVGINITADAAQAKAEIDSTAESTAALGETVKLNQENFAALDEIVANVRTELADLAEVLADDDASLDQMGLAIGRATVAYANLREVVATLQEAGQPVPASVLVSLDAAGEKVAALTAEFRGLTDAEATAGTAGAEAGEKMALGGVNIDRAATSSRGLKLALLGVTDSMGGIIGVMAPWLLLLTLAPTVISQLSKGIETLAGLISTGRDKLADWVEGVNESIDVERKKGETDDQYAERVKLITDLTQKAAEAQTAMNAGVIPQIDNVKLATVAWIAHEIALHPMPELYTLLGEAMKAAGLKSVESFSEVQEKAQALEVTLDAILTVQGPRAAATWAAANRGAVVEIIQAYSDQGQKVPAQIQKVADALGIMSREQAAAKKIQDEYNTTLQKASDLYVSSLPKLSALSIEVARNAQEYEKSTAAIAEHNREANAAIESETKTTVAGLETQIDALKDKGLTDEEQASQENDLLSQITKVRTDALNKELANNAAAELSQKDLDSKEAEQLIKFQERAKAQGASLETLGDIRDALKGKVEDLTSKIEEELKQHGLNAAAAVAAGSRLSTEASPKVAAHADLIERVNRALRDGPDAMQAFTAGLDAGGGAVDRFIGKLIALQTQLAAATGSGIPGLQGGPALVGGQVP